MKNSAKPMYTMPAEWEPHSAVWLAWPYDEETFPEGRVEKAETAYAGMIKALQDSERVNLVVLDDDMKRRACDVIGLAGADPSAIRVFMTEYADVWLRDTAPLYVRNGSGKISLLKWVFNSWGNKFPELLIDAEIPGMIAYWDGLQLIEPGLVLEGGAVDVNGRGICLTTEQCLLNENRNPGITREEIEAHLKIYIGAEKTIWLRRGLVNDHTDGHIDELARFVAPRRIVAAFEEDENDPNYEILADNYHTLSQARDTNGEPFEIVKLPMPHMTYNDGKKAPVSYTNFYIGNKVVLMPLFNDENDGKALKILANCFPDREIAGIDCTDIIYGGGALHCITQQVPE